MSKQDIEKRLGFAAQGVKSEFGSNDPYMQERTVKTRKGKTTDLVAEIGQNGGGGDYIATLMLVHSNGEPQVLQSKYGYKTPESATRAAIRLFDAHVSRGGYARSGSKAKMAAPKKNVGYLAVTNSEYAALAASDAAGKRISSNSQYQITSEDRAIMAAGKAAAKSALARHDAWDKAWRNAPNDAARAKVEAEAEKAESGMKKYPVTRLHFARTSAKAKFAKPQFRTKKLHNGYIAVEVNQGNGWERYDTTHEESWNGIEEYERGYQKAYDRGLRYSGGSWRIPSTNAARPGVKANMGLEMNMLDFRHKFFTAFGTAIRDAKSNPNTAEAQSDETVLRESWASMFAQGYSDAISDLNGLSATMKSKTSVGQMRKAASDAMEAYRQAKAAVRSSRPGVKATFGLRVPELETLYSSLGASGQAITDKPSARKDRALLLKLDAEYSQPTDTVMVALNAAKLYRQLSAGSKATPQGQKFQQRLEIAGGHRFARPGAKAKMAAEIASDPRDKDFEKLKTLKGVVHQGKGFYIIPNKLMTPERRTKVKRSTQRYELSNMGDLVGWGTNHPNVNDYRLKDWAEAFA